MITLKNMKFTKWGKALVGTLVVFSFSCTNLDEELFSSVTDDQFGNTDEEISAIVASAYTGWTGSYIGEGWSLAQVASDETVVPTRGADWFDNGNWQRLHLHAMLPQDDRVQGSWRELFGRGINTANRLIKSFEEAGQDPATSPAIAELRGLRAMIYFWLMDLYGNVPLQKSFDQTDLTNGSGTDYSQRTEVYNYLVDELVAIIPVLEGLPISSDNSRFNEWAAKMLLAKLYLNENVYTTAPTNGSYKQASAPALGAVVSLTTDVIDAGGYSLASDYFANFDANSIAAGLSKLP